MQVSLFLLRLRTVMIVVAVVGGVFALVVETRRLAQVSLVNRKRAELMRLEEEYWVSLAKRSESLIKAVEAQRELGGSEDPVQRKQIGDRIDDLRVEAANIEPKRHHFTELRLKYERAANRPWETVLPDPPEPR